MTVILANGVIVESEGTAVDMGTVKKVLAGVDLGRIEALKRPPPSRRALPLPLRRSISIATRNTP